MQFPGAGIVESLLIIKTTLSMTPVVLKCFDLSYLSSVRCVSRQNELTDEHLEHALLRRLLLTASLAHRRHPRER